VITSRSAPVLSGKRARDREEAAQRREGFTAAELEYLGISAERAEGHGKKEADGRLFDTHPVDQNTTKQKQAVPLREANPLTGD
jgi:hypothetical protein